jgi:hypothetical protein
MPVIVSRSERDQRRPEQQDSIRESLPPFAERIFGAQRAGAPQSYRQKGKIGRDVPEVGNSENGPLVREGVIAAVLVDWRKYEDGGSGGAGQDNRDCGTPFHSATW